MTNAHALPVAWTALRPLPLARASRPGFGPGAATARSLSRRLALALYDLGLAGVLPAGWATPEGAGLRFADLDVVTADRLVRLLEDLAAALPPPAPPAPGRDQATLFPAGA